MSTTLDKVLPVLDAKEPITLRITEADIVGADPKNPEDCAIARACRRQLHAKEVHVHLGRTYMRFNAGNFIRYDTPNSAARELIALDRGGRFASGEHTFNKPRHSTTGKRQGAKKWKARRTKFTRPRHIVTDVREGPAA